MTTTLNSRITPALLVRDMRETLDFYQRLGFHVSGSHPDGTQATWAEVRRDGAILQFHAHPPVGTPESPVFSGTLYFHPDNVLALADEFSREVEFSWGPEVMDYGMREFGIRDPNGYYLAFTEPA